MCTGALGGYHETRRLIWGRVIAPPRAAWVTAAEDDMGNATHFVIC